MQKNFVYRGLAAALFLLVGLVPASAQFRVNLINDGDAESPFFAQQNSFGSTIIPGFTTTGGLTLVPYNSGPIFPMSTDPGPPGRGHSFFAGGTSPSATGTQNINLVADSPYIDTGHITYSLSGYFGGYAAENNNARLTAVFKGATGQTLGAAYIGPTYAADRNFKTGLIFKGTDGIVPVGARTVSLILQMNRTDGTYDTAYADNLVFMLNVQQHPVGVPEPGVCALLTAGAGSLWMSRRRRRT